MGVCQRDPRAIGAAECSSTTTYREANFPADALTNLDVEATFTSIICLPQNVKGFILLGRYGLLSL